ncbi:unnamed protein product [Rotaria socialis]|uniref:Large ribosomal subunit protein mL52 n=1 Tax=Rotaria socialis TaxID=392032 RepID=A0A821QWV6_9BILA|nr:unnamed protein product [Rotaria socialis]CAF3435006.1 unnamed protein product [Rotaria socialis]CAF3520766.1 unnamed protein product [Rotaria socialis]CAF3588063.1 unnamed protein product [Rotaria socialis]CAF3708442.1 unnamed protein product [Rotaria socialis]
MLARCSIITKRAFSKDFLATRWKRADPNRYWRVQHKLPTDDEEHGPLADLPDYSYLNSEPSHLSAVQRKKYDFNASVVHRIHELDSELKSAKKLYAKKIESTMAEYNKTVQIAQHIKTPSSSTKSTIESLGRKPTPSITYPNEYSLQPNLLNALRKTTTYNEAYEEVVDPVGAIIPDKLMNTERPPYKHTGERRRYHKIFTLRTPKLRMFPR